MSIKNTVEQITLFVDNKREMTEIALKNVHYHTINEIYEHVNFNGYHQLRIETPDQLISLRIDSAFSPVITLSKVQVLEQSYYELSINNVLLVRFAFVVVLSKDEKFKIISMLENSVNDMIKRAKSQVR